jgi:rubredoxin
MTSFWIILAIVLAVGLGAELWARRRRHRWNPPQTEPARPQLDFPHLAPPMLHFLDKATERPVCGASIREAWTIIPETATCPECRKQGDLAMLQWFANNR